MKYKDILFRFAFFVFMVCGFVVYGNSLFNDFVLDDFSQITENPAIHTVTSIPLFFTGSTYYNGSLQRLTGIYYKPMLSITFTFLYFLFGPNPFIFHLFQIFLHVFNTYILFLLLNHFFRKPPAFVLSFIFLIHPINSESVLYVSAMQEELFFLFGISSLYFLVSEIPKKYIQSLLCLFASLLSKEAGILFLCIDLFYVLIFHKRKFAHLLIAAFIVLVFYFLLRFHALGFAVVPLSSPISMLDLPNRLLHIPSIFIFYLNTFLYPLYLSFSRQWIITQFNVFTFILPFFVIVLLLGGIIVFSIFLHINYYLKNLKTFSFFCIWFFIGMVLHLQIIPLDETVAERWFYFPIVGILGMVGVFYEVLIIRINNKQKISTIQFLLTLYIILLSVRTFIRTFNWRNNFSLVTHDIQVNKDDYSIENLFASELIKQGRYNEAQIHATRSVKLYPYLTNYNTLGISFVYLHDYQNAKIAFENALKLGDFYVTYENLGRLAIVSGLYNNENITFLNNAIRKFPTSPQLKFLLAIMLYKTDNVERAKEAITQAYQLNSKDLKIQSVYTLIMNNQPLTIKF